MVVIITLKVLCSSYERPNTDENALTKITLNTTVKAVGSALANTLNKKLPSTNLLLGSSANTNDGAPIVNVVINVNWIGIKKYFWNDNILNIISIIVYNVLNSKRLAKKKVK